MKDKDKDDRQNLCNFRVVPVFLELIRLTGGGLAPSSQTVGALLKTPWLAKPGRKMPFGEV